MMTILTRSVSGYSNREGTTSAPQACCPRSRRNLPTITGRTRRLLPPAPAPAPRLLSPHKLRPRVSRRQQAWTTRAPIRTQVRLSRAAANRAMHAPNRRAAETGETTALPCACRQSERASDACQFRDARPLAPSGAATGLLRRPLPPSLPLPPPKPAAQPAPCRRPACPAQPAPADRPSLPPSLLPAAQPCPLPPSLPPAAPSLAPCPAQPLPPPSLAPCRRPACPSAAQPAPCRRPALPPAAAQPAPRRLAPAAAQPAPAAAQPCPLPPPALPLPPPSLPPAAAQPCPRNRSHSAQRMARNPPSAERMSCLPPDGFAQSSRYLCLSNRTPQERRCYAGPPRRLTIH